MGIITTNTISQGDTRQSALQPILQTKDSKIYRAQRSFPWPGIAVLQVSIVYISIDGWIGTVFLDDKIVKEISASLEDEILSGDPQKLLINADKCFEGVKVYGMGFAIDPGEAYSLINSDPRNKEVLFPFHNSKDLNSRADHSPSRWVINFFDWPLERALPEIWNSFDGIEKDRLVRQGIVDPSYGLPVAADFPECLSILRERVKPERDALKDSTDGGKLKIFWWRYARLTSCSRAKPCSNSIKMR